MMRHRKIRLWMIKHAMECPPIGGLASWTISGIMVRERMWLHNFMTNRYKGGIHYTIDNNLYVKLFIKPNGIHARRIK